MQSSRMTGRYIMTLAEKNNVSKKELSEKLSCDISQVEDLFAGRFILPFWKLESLSDLFGVSVSQILDGDPDEYNANVVHCMNDFNNPDNREKILNIIDDYLDIKEALGQ